MFGTVLAVAPGGFAYNACIRCRCKVVLHCSRCRGPLKAPVGSSLRYILRLTVVLKSQGPKADQPVEYTLFGDSVAWLFGGPPDRFVAKVAALQAPLAHARRDVPVPSSAAAAAAGTINDPLLFVALQQCLIGESFIFADVRDSSKSARHTHARPPRVQCYTAGSMTPLIAGRYETVPTVYAALLYREPSPNHARDAARHGAVPMVSESNLEDWESPEQPVAWASQSFVAPSLSPRWVLSPLATGSSAPPPPAWDDQQSIDQSLMSALCPPFVAQRDTAWASLIDASTEGGVATVSHAGALALVSLDVGNYALGDVVGAAAASTAAPFHSTGSTIAKNSCSPCSDIGEELSSGSSLLFDIVQAKLPSPSLPVGAVQTRAATRKHATPTGTPVIMPSSPKSALPLSTPRLFSPHSLRRRPLCVINAAPTVSQSSLSSLSTQSGPDLDALLATCVESSPPESTQAGHQLQSAPRMRRFASSSHSSCVADAAQHSGKLPCADDSAEPLAKTPRQSHVLKECGAPQRRPTDRVASSSKAAPYVRK